MNDLRLRFRLLTPLGTPLNSDIIFGHLVWAERLLRGDRGVAEMLAKFTEGEPPLILSDGFPRDLLPAPYGQVRLRGTAGTLAEHRERKKWGKARLLDQVQFTASLAGEEIFGQPAPESWEGVATLHASLSRTTGTTSGEGNLYATEEMMLRDEPVFSVYIRVRDDFRETALELFQTMAAVGFGRDKSTGKGQIELLGSDPEWKGFPSTKGADGFVSLSSLIPAADDPVEGRWRLRTKYGKLGESAGRGNPFKRPIIQLDAGAVFRTAAAPRSWYGRIVSGIAPGMPEAVQYGLALAVPCRYRSLGDLIR